MTTPITRLAEIAERHGKAADCARGNGEQTLAGKLRACADELEGRTDG